MRQKYTYNAIIQGINQLTKGKVKKKNFGFNHIKKRFGKNSFKLTKKKT